MKKTINGKRYDTATADKVAYWGNSYSQSDFHWCEETLYRTKKGNWFLVGEGGPMSQYSVQVGNGYGYGDALIPMTQKEALDWCERSGNDDAIDQFFSDLIEEA